ncbi:UNVERIFIED_CONTAM: hypothetical protein GTU68_023413 [Idotea baltica]|nr:hypothetical protein [Idotea baltica]
MADALSAEEKRQQEVFRLIPSENYIYEPARIALGAAVCDKYSEGYPHKWTKNTAERVTIKRAIELFAPAGTTSDYHANVQPLSGANANLAVYTALIKPGDRILGMSLAHGGHLTHGHGVSVSSKFFEAHQYTLGDDLLLDYDAIRKQAKEVQPALIICGASSYTREIDFAAFADIAKEVGALLHADVAHISGLCVTGCHMNPFPHADVVTTTTHKILRGPRGGMILCKKEHGPAIDRAVFPGLQGGPHMNKIAALGITLKHALSDEYKSYAQQVVANAKQLADSLIENGFELTTGGTDNHMLTIDLKKGLPAGRLDGTSYAELLEDAGIVLNKNSIPGDEKPWKPTGVRLGTPAITSLGMKEAEMKQLAAWFAELAVEGADSTTAQRVASEVKEVMTKFPIPAWLA